MPCRVRSYYAGGSSTDNTQSVDIFTAFRRRRQVAQRCCYSTPCSYYKAREWANPSAAGM